MSKFPIIIENLATNSFELISNVEELPLMQKFIVIKLNADGAMLKAYKLGVEHE